VWQAAPDLSLVHDVSDGGLEVAIQEMAAWSGVPSNSLLLGDSGPAVRFVLAGASVPGFAEEVGEI
jgi:phosphoribosylformylglycinamidine (FGAM) synthase-like enzyme